MVSGCGEASDPRVASRLKSAIQGHQVKQAVRLWANAATCLIKLYTNVLCVKVHLSLLQPVLRRVKTVQVKGQQPLCAVVAGLISLPQ